VTKTALVRNPNSTSDSLINRQVKTLDTTRIVLKKF
jgi:hypothetical protein